MKDIPLRIVLGLPFVLFVPGYAFIAALFPEHGEGPTIEEGEENFNEVTEAADSSLRERGIDGIKRVALSFGLSIAIVPLIGLVLNFTPWGIRLLPVFLGVSAFTLAATGVAAVRRGELPAEERFRVPYRQWLEASREEFLDVETRTDKALTILLVSSLLLAVSSVTYAVAVPKQGESFTEFYLLTRTDEGDLVAADYPSGASEGIQIRTERRLGGLSITPREVGRVKLSMIPPDGVSLEPGFGGVWMDVAETVRER